MAESPVAAFSRAMTGNPIPGPYVLPGALGALKGDIMVETSFVMNISDKYGQHVPQNGGTIRLFINKNALKPVLAKLVQPISEQEWIDAADLFSDAVIESYGAIGGFVDEYSSLRFRKKFESE